jgi:FG-GAP repeat
LTDGGLGPVLAPKDKFGMAVTGYQDLDQNGIKEVVVGSPGYDNDKGALYIMFMRRRRFHPPVPDLFLRYFIIIAPLAFIVLCCCCSCCYFFWHFRRRPDEVEIAVLASDIVVGKQRDRQVMEKSSVAGADDDEYPG